MKCPSFERLIDYLDDRLDRAEADRFATHLSAGCPQCAETRDWYERVRVIAASDESIEPPSWVFKRAVRIFENKPSRPRLVERMGQVFATLIFDSLAQPAVAGVRSTETTNRQLLYRAGDYSIDLQVAPAEHLRTDLTGQILKEGELAFDSVSGLRLEISRGGAPVFSTVTGDLGEFKISGVDYGVYDLRVDVGNGSITVEGLPLAQS
ncbi:MAG TPA: zf-HC2 domain-containing protein [Blastocatellia bacterium]|jgi:hypothetical protein|nr:zf-HC2 domain-containing protein [Blastocatellia bacterium]